VIPQALLLCGSHCFHTLDDPPCSGLFTSDLSKTLCQNSDCSSPGYFLSPYVPRCAVLYCCSYYSSSCPPCASASRCFRTALLAPLELTVPCPRRPPNARCVGLESIALPVDSTPSFIAPHATRPLCVSLVPADRFYPQVRDQQAPSSV
jgi:hypothetical protein